jgi:hypothetical protein
MVETIIIVCVVVFVGILIFPTSNGKKAYDNLFSKCVQPENCTCKNWGQLSFDLDYNCPVHGDWR